MEIDAPRLLALLHKVSLLCDRDPVYWKIFDRLDAEYEAARAGADPIARARTRRRTQNAMALISS